MTLFNAHTLKRRQRMKRSIIFIALFIISTVLSCIGSHTDKILLVCISTIASGVLGSIISIAFEKMDFLGHGFKLWFQQIKYKDKDIRLSFSYLYRIQVNGKYLLVKGNRLKNQFQPVGGVYKYYKEAKPFLEEINFHPDIKMHNFDEKNDLRINIKGKYLLSFMKWFLLMKDREYDPRREFKEELIDTGLLPENKFKQLNYRKVFVHNKGVVFSNYNNCLEFIYSDIFDLDLTDEQIEAVIKSVEEHPESLCLVTADELKSECYNGIEKNIGNNAKWLLGE